MNTNALQRRKERIDRGIKIRTDGLYALMSWREMAYVAAPRVLPVVLCLVLPLLLPWSWMPWSATSGGSTATNCARACL